MKHVTLGRTGLRAKKLAFGGLTIQRVKEGAAVEMVRYAVEKGIDFIDTARAYSTSERRIGLALKQTDQSVRLASKSLGITAGEIRSDIETSLKHLQRDYIDIYQCHNVPENEYPQIIGKGGAVEGLLEAKNEGLVGHIGVSSHSLDLLSRILDDDIFDTIMLCFSFLEPDALNAVIPKALDKNVGVIAMKPLSGGVLECAKPALKYVLSREGILALCGVETKDRFDENWDIFNGDHTLTDEDQKEIDTVRSAHDKNFCRRCDYCQPCTEDIDIQTIIGARYLVKRMGKEVFIDPSRAAMIETARNCSECGECMTRCPYDLPIPDLIKENLAFLDNLYRRKTDC